MPRNTGIGMPRAKKARREQVEKPSVVDASGEAAELVLSASPSPERSDPIPAVDKPKTAAAPGTILELEVERWHGHMIVLKEEYDKCHIVWRRKKKFLHGDEYSLYREPSVVKRDEARLMEADLKLLLYKNMWIRTRNVWRTFRTAHMLAKSSNKSVKFLQLSIDAIRRARRLGDISLADCVRDAKVDARRFNFPARDAGHFKDYLADQYGLGLAYGLEYSDRL